MNSLSSYSTSLGGPRLTAGGRQEAKYLANVNEEALNKSYINRRIKRRHYARIPEVTELVVDREEVHTVDRTEQRRARSSPPTASNSPPSQRPRRQKRMSRKGKQHVTKSSSEESDSPPHTQMKDELIEFDQVNIQSSNVNQEDCFDYKRCANRPMNLEFLNPGNTGEGPSWTNQGHTELSGDDGADDEVYIEQTTTYQSSKLVYTTTEGQVIDDLEEEEIVNVGPVCSSTPLQTSNETSTQITETSKDPIDRTRWFKASELALPKVHKNIAIEKKESTKKIIGWKFDDQRNMYVIQLKFP
ncbi:hypothetical protein L1987_34084 [Smallanthus sonchifolius]|uniref:Uncharacterized protein n=1 Tax=Smallanthus sonchifolius TaxID=185202 RepID=A0ACB9HU90_9ASTR|nr:hypothetical protein L1987_34084 [Smallanthus sonchifolius]